MKILITGGSGFIASHFYAPLVAAGHEIVNCDLIDPPPQARGATFVRSDIRDRVGLWRAMSGCDAVLHLAAAHHDFGIAEQTFVDVNAAGAEVICQAMDEHGITKLCFYSTVAVYGSASPPHYEDAGVAPVSAYGSSKLAGEAVCRRWSERGGGRSCLVIRPTATIGAGHFANMYSLIRQIDSGRFWPVGKGRNIKSLACVENLVDATIALWLEQTPGHRPFDIYNYVDKPDLTSAEIVTILHEALGRRPPRIAVPYPFAMALALPFDLAIGISGRNLPISRDRIRKLATAETRFEAEKIRATGFRPRMSLEAGLTRMVQWYLAEGKNQRVARHLPPASPMLVADHSLRPS
jgi:nucleoside-diphosphate-sugar epimerase